jgi:hypothetical protein
VTSTTYTSKTSQLRNPEIILQHVRDISKIENYYSPENRILICRSVLHVFRQLKIPGYNNICLPYFVLFICGTALAGNVCTSVSVFLCLFLFMGLFYSIECQGLIYPFFYLLGIFAS